MASPDEIVKEVLKTGPADKAKLVDQLLYDIDNLDKVIEKKWTQEAESRVQAYEDGKLNAVSLEEVLAKYI